MSHPFLFITGYARFAVADTEAAALIELCGALSVPCRSEASAERARTGAEMLSSSAHRHLFRDCFAWQRDAE